MAFYTDPNADKDKEQEEGMNAPIATSTQSSAITPGTPGNIATQQVKTPKAATSGMTGFNQFAKANQGTAQNRLNASATQNVQNQGKQANNAITQATASFGQKVDAGSLKDRHNAVSDVANITNAARNVSAAPKAPVQAPLVTPQDVASTGQTYVKGKSPGGLFAANSQQPQVSGGAIPQVATPQTPPQVQAPVTQSPANNAFAGIDQNQQNRFQEVINSRYQGPESLRQAGLYQVASGKVQGAQNALNQTKTAGGREDLLKNMNAQRGDYSTGLNKLDAALLNANKAGVQGLQQAAQAQGNVGQKLDQAQIASANLAQNRGQEIKSIQEQARNTFTQGQAAERAATDERLSKVVDNWEQLPEYFRDIIRKQEGGGANLNSIEAGILGVNSGEGLYNAGADVIKTAQADKNKLISRDEQTRQAVLAQLAGLDQQQRLDTNLKYDKADMAGTQTALDALDLEGTRAGLNAAEKSFQDYAKEADITGYGNKKNRSSGKRYYAEETANLGDLLTKSGYKFGEGEKANVGNRDLLNNVAKISRGEATGANATRGMEGASEAMNAGIATGGSTPGRDVLDGYGAATGINALTGALGLGSLTDATMKGYNTVMDGGMIPGLNEGMDKLGLGGIMPSNKGMLDALTFGQGSKIVPSILGGSGASSRESKNIASGLAQQDLQNKIQSTLKDQGYDNRIAVQDNEATTSRLSGLQQLLANMDKTNS